MKKGGQATLGGCVKINQIDLWFAKTLADFEINDIAALPPLFSYNSQPRFDSSTCASERWFASCARLSLLLENLALRQQLAVLKRRHPRQD